MFAYIVRRLLGAVGLLFLLSVITFAIFYLVPRWAGATPETLATRYVGRAATAETVTLTAQKLGFYDPLPVQYWNWLKGIFVGTEYDYGAGIEKCPAPCLGYSFVTKQAVWPEMLDSALQELDEEKRTQMWGAIDKRVMEEAVIYPGVYAKSLLLRSKNATNVFVTDAYGEYDYVGMGAQK